MDGNSYDLPLLQLFKAQKSIKISQSFLTFANFTQGLVLLLVQGEET